MNAPSWWNAGAMNAAAMDSMTPPPGGSTDVPVPPTAAKPSSGTDTTKVLLWGGVALVALYFATKSSGKGFRLI